MTARRDKGSPFALAPWLLPSVGLLAVAFGAAVLVGALLSRTPAFAIKDLPHDALCAAADPAKVNATEAFRFYAADARQLAMFTLLCVAAGIALVASAAAARSTARQCGKDSGCPKSALVITFVVGLALAGAHVIRVVWWDSGSGFLTRLLQVLPSGGSCDVIRGRVLAARLVGETAGFIVGTAMAGVAVFGDAKEVVAGRIQMLQRLLYCASLLFVAGLLVSGANFALVLSNWVGSVDEKVSKALQEVISGGTAQAGVGYSALITVFYLPIRIYLASKVPPGDVAAKKEASDAPKVAGINLVWLDEAKQILALLAPVLAAPIFDAIAKTK